MTAPIEKHARQLRMIYSDHVEHQPTAVPRNRTCNTTRVCYRPSTCIAVWAQSQLRGCVPRGQSDLDRVGTKNRFKDRSGSAVGVSGLNSCGTRFVVLSVWNGGGRVSCPGDDGDEVYTVPVWGCP